MDDLASTPAFVFLEEQVASGVISAATADSYKARFSELYRIAHNSVEREKDQLAKAREMRTLVREEQIALEKSRIRKEELEALNEQAEADRKKWAAALSDTEAKETSCSQELNELKLREVELQEDVAALQRENEAHVQPQLNAITQETAEARADLARCVAQHDSMVHSKAVLASQLSDLEDQVAAARTTANALRIELIRVKGEPERASKAVDSVTHAIENVTKELTRAKAAIGSRDTEIADQKSASAVLMQAKRDVEAKLAKYRADIDAREQEISNVERSLRAERMQYKDLLEQRINLQTEESASLAAVRTAENEKDAVSAAYERAKRELKRKTDAGNDLFAEVPAFESQLTERKLELARLEAEGKDLEAQIAGMKREMDLLLAQFMKAEGVEKRHREKLSELLDACSTLELEKDQWHKEEVLCQKQLSAIKAQRDVKSRDLAKMVASRKLTIEQSKMKELQLLDLSKQLGDINVRLRQFAAMYEVVKNERNTFANNIQSASQSISEMRERIKILNNEVDILQNESNAKDKALTKEQQAHAVAAVQRDALRAETNKSAVTYRERQTGVESQIMAIDKLNSIINGLERQMLTLKKKYEAAVETRNYTGIQLIDRNDELCILYEKSNIHEKTLGDGETALRESNEEIRSMRICLADLDRQLQMARSKLPDTPGLAEQILDLQRQLVQARQVTEKLCQDLESPASSDRWIELGGEDPDIEKLKLRIVQLESRVNAAREELLEKDLVLEEITTLAQRLQAAATAATESAAGSTTLGTLRPADAPGPSLAKQANELQAKIKDANRKLMAVVSELSMYQATAIKMADETAIAQEALSKAEDAAARGLPPTVAAEQKWQFAERAKAMPSGSATVKLDSTTVDGPQTTAEARPNAYIPEGVGLPKPYGEFPPYKPSEPGAIMRFFRNPEMPDVEL